MQKEKEEVQAAMDTIDKPPLSRACNILGTTAKQILPDTALEAPKFQAQSKLVLAQEMRLTATECHYRSTSSMADMAPSAP